MAEDMYDECEGCVMFRKYKSCDVIKSGREKGCPCRLCLVKIMCNTACKEYEKYISKIHTWPKKEVFYLK